MNETETFLRRPLIRLAGGVITPGALLVGVVVVAGTALLSAIVGRGLRRMLKRRGLSPGAQFATVKIARYVLTLIGLLVAIDSIGLSLSAVLAASTVLMVGIGFGLQNIAQNFISGLIVLFEQPVRPGDFIKVGDAYGIVAAIGLRATRVVTRDQVTIIVPNSELVTTQVINHSIPTPNLRIAISVGVAYGTDTELIFARRCSPCRCRIRTYWQNPRPRSDSKSSATPASTFPSWSGFRILERIAGCRPICGSRSSAGFEPWG